MYCQIINTGCPAGYAFVRDYMGNRIFYGTVDECRDCMDVLNGKKKRKAKKSQKGGRKNVHS